MAFGTSKMIPDYENPLFHDIKPFDLTFCFKNPTRIDKGNLKIMKVISKCSFKDAIYNVSRGMSFYEGRYPLSLVLEVINREISPLDAIDMLDKTPKKNYVPHFYQFIHEFKGFIINEILRGDLRKLGDLKKIANINVEFIISLIGLTKILSGIQLPYSEIITILLESDITRNSLRSKLIKSVHEFIETTLKKGEIGSTIIFDFYFTFKAGLGSINYSIVDLKKVNNK
jgi:hypothetical protein